MDWKHTLALAAIVVPLAGMQADSAMTDAELRDAAVVELKKTTVGWLKSNGQPRYPPGPSSDVPWGKAMNLLAQIGQPAPPPPPPPPPTGLGIDRATMLATGGTILREDTSAVANPEPGLWGNIEAVSDARHVHVASGGDPRPKANSAAQGNSAFRRLTVQNGDDFYGERCELGRNNYSNGENTGTQTSGTFALYKEGERKITFFSMRFGSGFTSALDSWQVIMQMKQTQPYGGNGPTNGAPAIEVQVFDGRVRLHSFWQEKWTAPAPANGVWTRYALDITYSQDPAKGKAQMFVDVDGDGDFLDSNEASPVIAMRTLAYVTSQGGGSIPNGGSIPGHLRLGIYHDEGAYGTTTVDLDNVQVVG